MNDNITELYSVKDAISTLSELAFSHQYVFRGFSKSREMLPSIIRSNYKDEAEQTVLADFERYAGSYFHAISPIEFMSIAQHYGIPTRLLDYTYNPFIALSFAIHSPKQNDEDDNEDSDFYYLNYASLEKNLLLHEIPLKEELYRIPLLTSDSLAVKACHIIGKIEALFSEKPAIQFNASNLRDSRNNLSTTDEIKACQKKIDERVILFIDPALSNKRIIMQQGLFMFPYSLNSERHTTILSNNSTTIKIHKGLRRELLSYLDTLGYNTYRLMPDLPSICHEIRCRACDLLE